MNTGLTGNQDTCIVNQKICTEYTMTFFHTHGKDLLQGFIKGTTARL